MHVLGHSFSQRRKSKPRDLHIRKVSFSGSSLSSLSPTSSTTSSTSSSTARGDLTPRFNPLNLHPPFQAPPRLYDRPFIQRFDEPPTSFFFDDNASENSEPEDEADPHQHRSQGERCRQRRRPHMELPPHVSPMDHGGNSYDEPEDYFFMRLAAKRPSLPRSRWSESTIQTLDELTPVTSASDPLPSCTIADGDEEAEAEAAAAAADESGSFGEAEVPAAPPKRPPFKPMDSYDEFMKRGGWKRRGIVFQSEDMETFDTR